MPKSELILPSGEVRTIVPTCDLSRTYRSVTESRSPKRAAVPPLLNIRPWNHNPLVNSSPWTWTYFFNWPPLSSHLIATALLGCVFFDRSIGKKGEKSTSGPSHKTSTKLSPIYQCGRLLFLIRSMRTSMEAVVWNARPVKSWRLFLKNTFKQSLL